MSCPLIPYLAGSHTIMLHFIVQFFIIFQIYHIMYLLSDQISCFLLYLLMKSLLTLLILALRIHVSPDCRNVLSQLGGYQLFERGLVAMKVEYFYIPYHCMNYNYSATHYTARRSLLNKINDAQQRHFTASNHSMLRSGTQSLTAYGHPLHRLVDSLTIVYLLQQKFNSVASFLSAVLLPLLVYLVSSGLSALIGPIRLFSIIDNSGTRGLIEISHFIGLPGLNSF